MKESGRSSQARHLRECRCPRQSLPRVGKVASGASRIGQWRYEREREIVSSMPFARVPYPPLRGPLSLRGKAKRRRLRRPKRKPTPPRCARQSLPVEGGAPKGRRLNGGSGMKKIGKDRLKCVVYESTRAPLRGPPSPRGKATIRECRFSRIVRANTRICGKKNNDGQSLPRVGKVANEVSRIGY